MRPASAAHAAEMLTEFAEGADLPKLMRSANEKAATQPVVSDDRLSTNVDLPLATTSGNGGSFIRWAVTAAAFAFFAAGGVFITIETQKGQLVIESVDATVELKISKAGKEYDSVQLIPGANSTPFALQLLKRLAKRRRLRTYLISSRHFSAGTGRNCCSG